MDRLSRTLLKIGDWHVDPSTDHISRAGESVRVEARTMRLLLCLAEHGGEVISIDQLLSQVWTDVIVTPDSVYQAVASLRRQLGDDAKNPAYIETVPRLGYRMVATVGPWDKQPLFIPASPAGSDRTKLKRRRKAVAWFAGGALLCAVLAATIAFFFGTPGIHRPTEARMPIPIAVLPFLDLTTQAMDKEYFADGMTEELIDKLTTIPGVRVLPPTSSFAFKDRQLQPVEIAKSLGVAYLIDGSVRKSDTTMRIAARLIRGDDGFVVWSATYDRPIANELLIQDDIATEVAKVLNASLAVKDNGA
jgi:transcriptional activator of cad operon